MCEEKGYHLAIEAARRAGAPPVLAGRVFDYPAHRLYFEARIRPKLGARCCFLGPVGPRVRRRLLAGARALLVPSLVEETSSLVAMEALASATPVVALAHGALREIVDHGRTGFVVHGVDAMAEGHRAAPRDRPEGLPARRRGAVPSDANARSVLRAVSPGGGRERACGRVSSRSRSSTRCRARSARRGAGSRRAVRTRRSSRIRTGSCPGGRTSAPRPRRGSSASARAVS
ncbi:MAG: glycosyltransferase [Sandaracinaceae bacterium]|nr:glycosyltransferase [Sandaracinaceae bacterium]